MVVEEEIFCKDSFRSGLFVVGPESAGAHPGPVCYQKKGPLTVTDANLALGRLLPEYFPKIFGPNEDQPLDKSATKTAFDELTKDINEFLHKAPNAKNVPQQHFQLFIRFLINLCFRRI